MSILSVDTIQPIGSGSTVTLNAAKIVVGTGITFESNGQAIYAGIITATSFSGSGANLTSLPAANLTGTLPAISGANLTSLPAQATIANNADNRVITGGSGVNLNGEANLTFDGTVLSSDQIRYASGGNKYNGHPRSVVIGYSGSNYANLGMGWVPTSTNDQYTSANTDYQSRLQLYDGLQIY